MVGDWGFEAWGCGWPEQLAPEVEGVVSEDPVVAPEVVLDGKQIAEVAELVLPF